jgi:UDP-arabinose 4-epimerase
MKSVLVVGGAGYIGSHTCKELKRSGYNPVVLDSLLMGHEWAVKFGPFAKGDASDADFVKQTIEAHKIDSVIHFAANTYVGESVTNPRKFYHNNVAVLDSVLGACIDTGVDKFIFSSSCATYGIPTEVPIPENHAQNPISPYGETKLVGEKMLHWYSNAYALKHVALRYFNAAGADADGELGELHIPESHLIPLVLQAILGKRDKITVFGTDYPTADGTAVRDYIHVTDLARAHVKAVQYLENGGDSIQANLGTGTGISVQQIIDVAASVTGRNVPVEYGPRREGDPPALFSNPDYATKTLGWTPEHSDIENIIRTAWAWEQRQEKVS